MNLSFKNVVVSGIVGFNRSSREGLYIAHFLKGSDNRDSFVTVEKETTIVGFGSRGGNAAESFAKNMDSTIRFGVRGRGSW